MIISIMLTDQHGNRIVATPRLRNAVADLRFHVCQMMIWRHGRSPNPNTVWKLIKRHGAAHMKGIPPEIAPFVELRDRILIAEPADEKRLCREAFDLICSLEDLQYDFKI